MSAYLKLIGLAKGAKEFVGAWNSHARASHEMELKWIAALRSMGVKLAHPDDGWVNRKKHSISPCYPQFNDSPKVADLIALGCWYQHRIVRVTEVSVSRLSEEYVTYKFELPYLAIEEPRP